MKDGVLGKFSLVFKKLIQAFHVGGDGVFCPLRLPQIADKALAVVLAAVTICGALLFPEL